MGQEDTVLRLSPVNGVLPALDLARARLFYNETLGLETQDCVGCDGFLASAGGGTRIQLYHSPATTAPSAYTAARWEVGDLRSAVAQLKARGVVFEEYDLPSLRTVDGIAEMEGEWAAWFRDSEGNILNLSQVK